MSEWEAMSGIARSILTMSVSGSVIALFLFAIKPLIKNRLPQNAQYYLWSLVLVALLIPFSTFVSIPLGTPMTPVQAFIEENIKSTAEWQEEISLKQYNKPYEELAAPEQVEISYKEIGLLNGDFNNYLLFLLITLGGIVFLIQVIEYCFFAIKLRGRRLVAKDNEMALLRQLCENSRLPRLYRNPIAPTPMLMGTLCPVIYLPDMDYSEVQLRNVLLHELTHLRRHDVVIKWLAALAVNLHWFNPIVYYMHREIDRACELACDEAVINNLDTDKKQGYGDTLIAVVAERKLPKTIISTTMCEEKKSLKERLGVIMTSKRHTGKAMAVSGILLVVVLCSTVVFGASVIQESATDILLRVLKNESAVVRPKSVIAEVRLDDDGILIFYYNANGNLGCAILEQSLLNYEVVKTGAEITIESSTPVSLMAGQYNESNSWRVWGTLRDDSISKAVIYGQEANIVETDSLRFFYLLGDGSMPDNDDYLFYNKSGNLVWSIP